ncbi:hypothetical protein EJ02DRAFT_417495 [Clathrospora elynae]|uniref:DASH complex subunit DAD4 n=1 Tax=Clathrospora elynae TaxID=706981 RepID=A0A6A5T8H7_9PLEO|nr:hypothetical protein EJ02DRAFT_417495 [Clathrospora elynae]
MELAEVELSRRIVHTNCFDPPRQRQAKRESPHEHQQSQLLSRIIVNVEKLNEAIMMLNKNLQEINIQNMDTELVAQMFKNYQSNVLFHLEATNGLKDPA